MFGRKSKRILLLEQEVTFLTDMLNLACRQIDYLTHRLDTPLPIQAEDCDTYRYLVNWWRKNNLFSVHNKEQET